ncbi:MAG: hypothetical protein VB119_09750 [Candidatus Metalachnospira sp.]|nr:hypothetical protein [Candidatus Metalachnospira sp.]
MKEELLDFMAALNTKKERLTEQQYRTLSGQASAGDILGAKKGLHKLLKRGVKHAH